MAEVPKPIDPSYMTPKAGERPTGLAELEEIASPLGTLALGIVPLLGGLRELGVKEVDIVVEGSEELSGTMRLRTSEDGEVLVRIIGKLGSELPTLRGTPYSASWTGAFYRRANPSLPFIVEDDAVVEKGQMIAWGFVDKNTQWPIVSPKAGTVHFAAEHEAEVAKDDTVIFYLEETK
ncbi:MAG: hypothetical protein V4702_04095 [Patescibacteria group bacterium]